MGKKGLIIYMFFGLILLQYQNCAPTSQEFDNNASGTQEIADAQVDVIDQVEVGSVYFPQSKVTASDAEEYVRVIGACDQSGARIGWTLKSKDGALIERGLAECDRGSFIVELSDEWKNYCDESLYLKASVGVDASSETEVDPQCNFL